MTNLASATRAQFRSALLCVPVLLGLTACGGDDVASAPAASAGSSALVSPRLGMIDREPSTTVSTSTTTPTITPPTARPPSGSSSPPVASTGGIPPVQGPGIPPVKVTDGSATLDWTPPTQNNDGTTLTNLAG